MRRAGEGGGEKPVSSLEQLGFAEAGVGVGCVGGEKPEISRLEELDFDSNLKARANSESWAVQGEQFR